MNYSVLLPRSVDFDPIRASSIRRLPGRALAAAAALDLIQMLWDRGEPERLRARMTTDPLPDTPAHQVLLDVAFGDHQVTNYQAGRRGAHDRRPWPTARSSSPAAGPTPTCSGTCPDRDLPVHGLGRPTTGTSVRSAKNPGSGQFVGTEPAAPENMPNRSGRDPHGAPRATPAEQQLVSDFFEGAIQESDNCGGGPCFAIGFSGP